MSCVVSEPQIDIKQVRGLVRERNAYRRLLDECLYAFNVLRNQRIMQNPGGQTTYELAAKIEKSFRDFDGWEDKK